MLPPGLRGGLAAAMLGFFISTVRRAPQRAPQLAHGHTAHRSTAARSQLADGGGARDREGRRDRAAAWLSAAERGRAGGQHTTYIHAWGSTLVQDVVVPLYGAEHVSPAQQARLPTPLNKSFRAFALRRAGVSE